MMKMRKMITLTCLYSPSSNQSKRWHQPRPQRQRSSYNINNDDNDHSRDWMIPLYNKVKWTIEILSDEQNNVTWEGQIAWCLHVPCLFGSGSCIIILTIYLFHFFSCLRTSSVTWQRLLCWFVGTFESVPDLFHSVIDFVFCIYFKNKILVWNFQKASLHK